MTPGRQPAVTLYHSLQDVTPEETGRSTLSLQYFLQLHRIYNYLQKTFQLKKYSEVQPGKVVPLEFNSNTVDRMRRRMTYIWDIDCNLPHGTGPNVTHPLQEIIQGDLHQARHLAVREAGLFLQDSPQGTETCRERQDTTFTVYSTMTDRPITDKNKKPRTSCIL